MEKEGETMRTSSVKITLASTILTVLLIATPLEAQRRSTTAPAPRESQSMRIVRLMREAIARTFGPIAQARPTIPIPIQGEDPDTETSTESATRVKLIEQP
jgi:hypothetical protein